MVDRVNSEHLRLFAIEQTLLVGRHRCVDLGGRRVVHRDIEGGTIGEPDFGEYIVRRLDLLSCQRIDDPAQIVAPVKDDVLFELGAAKHRVSVLVIADELADRHAWTTLEQHDKLERRISLSILCRSTTLPSLRPTIRVAPRPRRALLQRSVAPRSVARPRRAPQKYRVPDCAGGCEPR